MSDGQLSLERTLLARERTMLAYFRTAFTILVFGLVVMKLFLSTVAYSVGVGSIILGILFFFMGFHYFPHRRNHKNL